MTEIIGVRFKGGGKQYYFDPKGLQVEEGQGVILETSRGPEYALCSLSNSMVEDEAVVQPLRPLIRIATEKDLVTVEENKIKAKTAFKACQQKIAEHGLDMKLVDVEYNFDGNKILFFFTSEGRVDFRSLVKDLASMFHSRIELRQIGVRDEAKMLGGLGICGKPFCCSTFLEDFQPVSIKMAKTQSLSLNPVKISGTCGRLMCCLKYEQDAYEDAVKRMPKNESFVETPDGIGNINQVNLLRETVKVRLDSAPDVPRNFHYSEVSVVRNGKGKRPDDYVAPSAQELEKLRKVTPPPEDPAVAFTSSIGGALSNLGVTAPTPSREAKPKDSREGKSTHRHEPHKGEQHKGDQPRQEKPRNDSPRIEKNKSEAPRHEKPKAKADPQSHDKNKPNRSKGEKNKPPQQAQQPQQPKQPPQAEGGEKKAPRRRRHRSGGGKPKTEGGTPANQG